jgi:hypothetical protein
MTPFVTDLIKVYRTSTSEVQEREHQQRRV